MRKHRILIATLVLGLFAVGSVAVASNMGFKFVPQIPGTAGANAFNLSLPWNNQYTNAASLFTDLGGAAAGIQRVVKYTTAGTLQTYNGTPLSTNFNLSKGEAYIVFGSGSGATPVIVGSHDPNFTHTFAAGATNAAAPYHQTYTNAAGLFTAINTACPGKLQRIVRYTPQATLQTYNGTPLSTNFNLVLGEGVLVFVNADCTGFVWAHY